MKRFLSLLLAVSMLVVFGLGKTTCVVAEEEDEIFNPSDPECLQRLQDDVFANLEEQFASDDFAVENVQVSYVSQEYLDELAFNSQENIFFGYTLEEVKAMYPDDYYVFTLGDDNTTTVEKFTAYDSSFPLETVIKNVAIGAGVILLCVTVSHLTAGTGTPKMIQFIYTFSTGATKMSKILSTSYALTNGITTGLKEYVQTGDKEASLKDAILMGSNGFKFGAIVGAVVGGIKGLWSAYGVPTWKSSEEYVAQKYGATRTQVSYFDGAECSSTLVGSTKPDVVVGKEAIEVKNYDLKKNLGKLLSEIEREITDRANNLPQDMTQRVVLDVTGRRYTQAFVKHVVQLVQERCASIYPNLPVDVIWTH